MKVLELLEMGSDLRERLRDNTRFFRERMTTLGFHILPGEHPIIPVMLGEAKIAAEMAERMLARGVYVVAFSYPVVPQGKARIRTQMSAAHSREDLEFAVEAFSQTKQEMGL
jgi:glycine C-acetyltransferase